MTIDPESWPAFSQLLDQWLEMPEESRDQWLDSLGPEHAASLPMLREIAFVQAKLGSAGLVDTLPKIGPAESVHQALFGPGARVGPYRLLRLLGEGGMSVVWLAEPVASDIKRQVALKLPVLTLNNPAMAERFNRERDILAQLTHPNIARLYDAGITDQGQPYLAMEFVEGEKIDRFCDKHALGLEGRLRLFLDVLRAVQYAHTSLIVHRDLKPGNILVTKGGEVRLVDFGIAKLLTEGEANETELTRVAGRALTLDYASPEQISGAAVTAASDVYSLGVVLYELLIGERPYRIKRNTQGKLEDAILGVDPVRPSQAIKGPGKKKLERALRGDLDTIILMALQKQPRDRYVTADAFAMDLQRYLTGEPVIAQPESRWYRARKFVRRNKLAVGAVTAVVAALSTGLGVALWQAHVARVQTQTAEAVQTFLLDIFRANSSANPDPVKARQTTARELLDAGVKQIDGALNNAPAAKLSVLETIFDLYNDMGLKEEGVLLAKKRVALAKAVYGPYHPQVATALVDLALNVGESSYVNERPAFLKEAENILDHNRDFTSETRAQFYFAVAADSLQTDLAKTADYAARAVQTFRSLPQSDRMAAALNLLGQSEIAQKRYREAIQTYSEAASIIQAQQGEMRHSLPAVYAHMADAYYFLLDIPGAEKYNRLALDTARSLKGEEHEDVFQTKYRLGSFYVLTSRPKEGLTLLKEALDLVLRTKGPENVFHTPMVREGYGIALFRYGRTEEGVIPISQAIDAHRRAKRDHTRDFADTLERAADGEITLGRYQRAAAMLDEASLIHTKVGDSSASGRLDNHAIERARLLAASGRAAEAEAVLKALDGQPDQLSFAWLDRAMARADVALAARRYEEAIHQARTVRQRIESSPMRPYFKRYEAPAALDEGKGLMRAHRAGEAAPLLKRSVDIGSEVYDPEQSLLLADSQIALAECLLTLGRRDEALPLLKRARAIEARHQERGNQYRQPLRDLESRLLEGQGK